MVARKKVGLGRTNIVMLGDIVWRERVDELVERLEVEPTIWCERDSLKFWAKRLAEGEKEGMQEGVSLTSLEIHLPVRVSSERHEVR